MVQPPVRQIGQLEVVANGDLVAVLHREPMRGVTHTFNGRFESVPHWTSLTPDNARRLATALCELADYLDQCSRAKGLSE